jgi:hypothetical protein
MAAREVLFTMVLASPLGVTEVLCSLTKNERLR